jgi:hypothetical protein
MVNVNSWTVFADTIQHQIALKQNYALMKYLPYLGLAFHLEYASSERQ